MSNKVSRVKRFAAMLTNFNDPELPLGSTAVSCVLASDYDALRDDYLAVLQTADRMATGALFAERDALRAALQNELAYLRQLDRGTTHWDGCDSQHPRCAAQKRMEAALNRNADQPNERLCKHDDGDCHADDPCDNCPVYRPASQTTEGQPK